MKRQVFFSFHFGNDIWRVGQIRNIGTIEGQVRLKRKTDIKAWIDKELNMRSCVIVLVGSETASREWVLYEIEEAWKRGKGIVAIYINKLKNNQGEQSERGYNPLKKFCIDKTFNYRLTWVASVLHLNLIIMIVIWYIRILERILWI